VGSLFPGHLLKAAKGQNRTERTWRTNYLEHHLTPATVVPASVGGTPPVLFLPSLRAAWRPVSRVVRPPAPRAGVAGVVTSSAASEPVNPRSRRPWAGEPSEPSPSVPVVLGRRAPGAIALLSSSVPVVIGVVLNRAGHLGARRPPGPGVLDRGRSPRPAEADGIPGHPPRNRASRVVPSGCASESARPPLAVLLTWVFSSPTASASSLRPASGLRRPRPASTPPSAPLPLSLSLYPIADLVTWSTG
jgi:hypothetical protein